MIARLFLTNLVSDGELGGMLHVFTVQQCLLLPQLLFLKPSNMIPNTKPKYDFFGLTPATSPQAKAAALSAVYLQRLPFQRLNGNYIFEKGFLFLPHSSDQSVPLEPHNWQHGQTWHVNHTSW